MTSSVLTSAKIHDFDLEILDLRVKLSYFSLQIVALLVDLVTLGMNFTTQITKLIIALVKNLIKIKNI